jgi:hypothetical protein
MRAVIMPPQLQLGCRRSSPRIRDWQAGALVGLILALLIVGDLPVVHDHDAPGLYDEDCPLARLGAVGPRASLALRPDLNLPAPAPEPAPVLTRALPSVVSPASFDPRAPPAASPLSSRAVVG